MKPFSGARVTWEGAAAGSYYEVVEVGDGWWTAWWPSGVVGGPFPDALFVEEGETLLNGKEHFIKKFKELYENQPL